MTSATSATTSCASSLRRRLEWELSLSWSDIRSHGWFHGSVSRSVAEQLLDTDGQFLVRDCSSRSGDYVLSCVHNSHHLHFVISKLVLQPNTVYERIQYTFEDECFDTITDLITFYVGNKRPISVASNAIITTPVNRCLPLTDSQMNSKKSIILDNNKTNCLQKSEMNLSEHEMSGSPPPKPSRIALKIYSQSSDDIIVTNESQHNIHLNCNELTQNSPKQECNQNESHGSEDSAFFSDSVSPKQRADNCGDYSKTELRQSIESREWSQISEISKTSERSQLLTIPPEMSSSVIRPQHFHTYLLPKDNKPLESTTITKINSVLCDTGARILANHLTKCDIDFINHSENSDDLGLGIESALELMLLPHGQQMRSDLLERHHCLKYFVVITVLSTVSDQKRAIVINKWIEIAIETKTALGDLFGFAAIMEALSVPPIVELKTIWAIVRKDFTQNAITYETKLRPQLKCMSECNEPQAPNTTFPYILTLVQILERHSKNMCQNDNDINIKSLDLAFEQTAVDYGLQQINSHLEQALQMIDQLSNYRRNAHIVLDGYQYEELLCDMFRTEFHRQFLFGFRGAFIDSEQKLEKLNEIVMAFASKCQTNIDSN